MTREELIKIKIDFPMPIEHWEESDEFGSYMTGAFRIKGKFVVVAIEAGLWHVSISTNHPLGYYELKEIRYAFCPNRLNMAQIFPPRQEFVNIHNNCYHLWEVNEK